MADFFVVAVMLVALELSRHTGSDDYLIGNFMVTQRNLLKTENSETLDNEVFRSFAGGATRTLFSLFYLIVKFKRNKK